MFRLSIFCLVVAFFLLVQVVSSNSDLKSIPPAPVQVIQAGPQAISPVAKDGVPLEPISLNSSRKVSPDKVCTGQWQGDPATVESGWFSGDEYYTVYQDPDQSGCSNTYPFKVTSVIWYVHAQSACSFDVQPLINDYSGPGVIGAVLCTGPVYTYDLPGAGTYQLIMPLLSSCSVSGPYYAGIYAMTALGTGVLDLVLDDGGSQNPPRYDANFAYYGSWQDVVYEYDFPGNLALWSEGETTPLPNNVSIPNMVVSANSKHVRIPIFINNDVELASITVPLVMKTTSGSASITSARLVYGERVSGVFGTLICNQLEDNDEFCTSYPSVSTDCGTDNPVASMPEAFLFAAINTGGGGLLPGNDASGSLSLIVDFGPGGGTLVLDTTCIAPANELYFIDASIKSVPVSFESGTIIVEPYETSAVDIPDIVTSTNQQNVEIPIFIDNSIELSSMAVPLVMKTLSGSASITSARMEYRERLPGGFESLSGVQITDNDDACTGFPAAGSEWGTDYSVASMPEAFIFGGIDFGGTGLLPGADANGSLFLIVDIGPGEGTMLLDTSCIAPSNDLSYYDIFGGYLVPNFGSGLITVGPSLSCCTNTRGNVNSDPSDAVNISDVTYLTAYLFGQPNGPAPACAEEGNVNGDPGETINISDVTYLIAYLFGQPSGPAPPSCP